MRFYFLIFFLLIANSTFATELSFEDVWIKYFDNSHELAALKSEKEASELASKRSHLHWIPKVSLMGQWSDTNDPGQVFFNYLGQRSVTQNDFNPASLNRPVRQRFANGALGLDLPLYEGGMRSNQTTMYDMILKSNEFEIKTKRTEEYTELVRRFGSLISFNLNSSALNRLRADLDLIINSYQVGSKSNPIGYSGLLGLRGVLNRVEGMLNEFGMQIKNNKDWISNKAKINDEWHPISTYKFFDFISNSLNNSESQSFSSLLLANEFKVSSMSHASNMEKARYLPKIGLFAQNNIYSGQRDSQASQSFGVYLMWELFNADSYNKFSEARAKTMAAEAKLLSGKQQESIMRENLRTSKITLEKNLILLDKSNDLLNEQSKNATKLFRSGLLNALQLAELMNRRVDVIEQKSKAELQYLEISSRLYQLNN
jgi:hypothetical protein